MKAKFNVKFEVIQKVDGGLTNHTESMSEIFELPFNKGICIMDKRNCTYISALKALSQIFKPKSKVINYQINITNICKL